MRRFGSHGHGQKTRSLRALASGLSVLFLVGAVHAPRAQGAPRAASLPLAFAAHEDEAKRAAKPATSDSMDSPRAVLPARSTLDSELQRASERLLRAANPLEGAIVMVDPATGHVLALAAHARSGRTEGLLTRARVPAASLFKIVTAAALLETRTWSFGSRICIAGGSHGIERRHLEPARGASAECSPFGYALGHSRNAVFAQLATRALTRQELIDVAERMGFNRTLSLRGLSENVELGQFRAPYNDLAFARAAAGFEGSSLSPLGAAYLATLVARQGEAVELSLENSETGAHSRDASEGLPPAPALSRETARALTRMLEVTVESGTSRAAFTMPTGKRYLGGIRVAGKTGTLKPDAGASMASWFIGFAPSRKPRVVVSVLLVNSSTYRRKANEVSRDLLRLYFRAQGAPVSSPFDDERIPVASTGSR
jgi:cell division protein FtsI/penicillin-binding protein 2